MLFRAVVAGIASIGVVAAVVATAPVAAVETADTARWTLEDRDCESESLADWQCYSLVCPAPLRGSVPGVRPGAVVVLPKARRPLRPF